MQKNIERLDAQSFDWVLLRNFLAVYRAGTVAAAARCLGQQQSTLSRHLAELEAKLGAPLFERTGRGLHATADAHIVAQFAAQMEASANQMALTLTAKSNALSGTVRISASQVFASHLLPPVINGLLRSHPDLQLELIASDEVPSLLNRATDIALRFDQPHELNVIARKLGEVPIAAMAHQSYLDVMGTPQHAVDLLDHHLIGLVTDKVMLQTLQGMGIAVTQAHFRLRTDDKGTYVRLLEAGAGICFVARLLLEQNPGLRQVLPDLPLPSLPCWLSTHSEISSTPLIRVVFDEIADAFSRRLAGYVQT
jgi:DNA-binding transcriptional LysR family regulator